MQLFNEGCGPQTLPCAALHKPGWSPYVSCLSCALRILLLGAFPRCQPLKRSWLCSWEHRETHANPCPQREAEGVTHYSHFNWLFPTWAGITSRNRRVFAILAAVPSLSLQILSNPAEVEQNGADPLQSGMSPEPARGLGPVPYQVNRS